MTNNNDAMDDYSNTQFFKWQSGHGKLSPISNSGGIEEASLRMAKIYQQGSIHGAELEQDRIIKLLEGYFKPEEAKSIYPANYEQYLDLIALIKGDQNVN